MESLQPNQNESLPDDTECQDEWYNADGSVNPNGAYDAGGHFYLERSLK